MGEKDKRIQTMINYPSHQTFVIIQYILLSLLVYKSFQNIVKACKLLPYKLKLFFGFIIHFEYLLRP